MSELEKKILGVLIHDEEKISIAIDLGLSASMFSTHSDIYQKVVDLYRQNEPVTTESILAHMPNRGSDLVDIIADSFITINPRPMIQDLIGLSMKKQLLKILRENSEMITTWEPGKSTDILTKAKSDILDSLTASEIPTNYKTLEPQQHILNRIDYYEKLWSGEIKTTPLKTGLDNLDRIFETMNDEGCYVVVAARTSTGKTTFAQNIGLNAALSGLKTLMFSVEMSEDLLTDRYLCINAEIPIKSLKHGDLTEEQHDLFAASAQQMAKNHFRINSRVGRDFQKLEDETRRLHRAGKVDVLIIDYLQQFRLYGKTHSNLKSEISEISARIQELKKTLKIPIFVLVQPSREYNQKAKVADSIMHYIKECGDIENDADIILHLRDPSSNDEESSNLREIIVEKNKLGPLGRFKLRVNLSTGLFEQYIY